MAKMVGNHYYRIEVVVSSVAPLKDSDRLTIERGLDTLFHEYSDAGVICDMSDMISFLDVTDVVEG
jgi:hypothetical protein